MNGEMMMVVLKTLDEANSRDLADILNTDAVLASVLGPASEPITGKEFLQHTRDWALKHKAQVFAMMLRDRAVGMISLSHQDYETGTARVGYWVGSDYWGRGYATDAFGQLLAIAKQLGLKRVTSRIKADNERSLAIWRKNHATFSVEGEMLLATLEL